MSLLGPGSAGGMLSLSIDELPTPCAVIDLDIIERNAQRMARRAKQLGVRLRPHVKTHKVPELASLQVQGHFGGITVSTLAEAAHFAAAGFSDITWALPLPPSRLQAAAELAERIDLGVLVDTESTAALLVEAGKPMGVWLKVDCGYHRAGVDPEDPAAMRILGMLQDARHLSLRGILTHAGHSYDTRGQPELLSAIARMERDICVDLASRAEALGIAIPQISVGSTPTCATVDHLEGITEMRPGVYLLMDRFQEELGVCGPGDIAISVMASVISQHHGRMILDAGALALSKDPGHGDGSYGRVLGIDGTPLPIHLHSLSQEHGIAQGHLPGLGKVRIQPNHACLVTAMHPTLYGVRGTEVVAQWSPVRGWNPSPLVGGQK